MTDKEIIKALDEAELFLRNRVRDGQPIKLSEDDVGILRNISQVCAKAYDKIDQLQTENENLKVENQSLRAAANSLKMHYEEAQAKIDKLNAENILTISERNAFQTSFNEVLKRLKSQKHALFEQQSYTADLQKQLKNAKSEAYKEVFEKLNKKAKVGKIIDKNFPFIIRVVTLHDINELKKEMVGKNNSDE